MDTEDLNNQLEKQVGPNYKFRYADIISKQSSITSVYKGINVNNKQDVCIQVISKENMAKIMQIDKEKIKAFLRQIKRDFQRIKDWKDKYT